MYSLEHGKPTTLFLSKKNKFVFAALVAILYRGIVFFWFFSKCSQISSSCFRLDPSCLLYRLSQVRKQTMYHPKCFVLSESANKSILKPNSKFASPHELCFLISPKLHQVSGCVFVCSVPCIIAGRVLKKSCLSQSFSSDLYCPMTTWKGVLIKNYQLPQALATKSKI